MGHMYGVIMSNGTHCDTSTTEKGAKNYATRHGYKEVSRRLNCGYSVEIVAHRAGSKWSAGPANRSTE